MAPSSDPYGTESLFEKVEDGWKQSTFQNKKEPAVFEVSELEMKVDPSHHSFPSTGFYEGECSLNREGKG